MMTNDGKKERHRRANNAFFRIKKTQKLCFLFLFFFTYRNQRGILSAPSISCGSYRRKSREINTSEQCLCPELFHNRGRNRNRRAGTTGFFLNPFFFFSQFYGANSSWSADQKKAFFLVLYMFVVCVSFVSFIRRPRRFLCVFFLGWIEWNHRHGAHLHTARQNTHTYAYTLPSSKNHENRDIYYIHTQV